jgi:cobalt-zinc-cadmium efflux system protein
MNRKESDPHKNYRILITVSGLTFGFLIIEVVFGIISNSLALLADAVHMFTDSSALALSAFAAWKVRQPAPPDKTYGYYRLEILVALLNGIVLLASTLYILYEAYQRFRSPQTVIGLEMLVIASIGLLVNLGGVFLLRPAADENLNVQSAFFEVAKDAFGSVGVMVAAAIVLTTGWPYADPIASVLIAIFILPRTWNLISQAVEVLMEASPAKIDIQEVEGAIQDIDGVDYVHDLHIWTITSEFISLSVHIVLSQHINRSQQQDILDQINQRLMAKFGIAHTTVQIEYRDLQDTEPRL